MTTMVAGFLGAVAGLGVLLVVAGLRGVPAGTLGSAAQRWSPSVDRLSLRLGLALGSRGGGVRGHPLAGGRRRRCGVRLHRADPSGRTSASAARGRAHRSGRSVGRAAARHDERGGRPARGDRRHGSGGPVADPYRGAGVGGPPPAGAAAGRAAALRLAAGLPGRRSGGRGAHPGLREARSPAVGRAQPRGRRQPRRGLAALADRSTARPHVQPGSPRLGSDRRGRRRVRGSQPCLSRPLRYSRRPGRAGPGVHPLVRIVLGAGAPGGGGAGRADPVPGGDR